MNMKQLIPRGVGLVLCLVVIALTVTIILVPTNPEDRALSLLEQQGYTVAAVRLLSDRLEGLDLQTSWDEAEKVYGKLLELAIEIESAPQMPGKVKREVAQLKAHAQIVMGKAKGERALAEGDLRGASLAFSEMEDGIEGSGEPLEKYEDLLSIDYYQKRIPALAMASTGEELERLFSRLFEWAIELVREDPEQLNAYLRTLGGVKSIAWDPSVPPEQAAVACQYASLLAYLTDKGEEARELIAKEAELSPGFPSLVSLPPNLRAGFAREVLYWKLERASGLGEIAFDGGDYKAALEAFQQMEEDVERGGGSPEAFASFFDPDYFARLARSLIEVAPPDLAEELTDLFEWALAVTGAKRITPELKARLEAEYAGLEALVAELGVSEVKSAVLEELAFLAFVLGEGEASIDFVTQWVDLQDELAEVQGIYTLQELAEQPEVAKFTIRGNGTFTSMDIVFTYVARPIKVLIWPVVFRYRGTGVRYQDMVIYYVEVIEVSEPRTITIPALCLDYTAEVPAEGLSDYEIEEIGDYWQGLQEDKEALMRMLYLFQFIERSRERLRGSGLRGEWNVLLDFPELLWERLRADLVWNLTNPEEWQDIKQDLVSRLQIYWMTDYLVRKLPFPSEWSSRERELFASEVAFLLEEGGGDWGTRLQNFAMLIELMLPQWSGPEQLQQALRRILEDEATPSEIRQVLGRHLQLIYWQILENHNYLTHLRAIKGYLERHLEDLLGALERFGTESAARVNAVLDLLERGFGLKLRREGDQ